MWNDPQRAQSLLAERNRLEESINTYSKQERDLKDTIELIELAEAEDDQSVIDESRETLENLRRHVQKSELEALLCGEADANDTFLELHAGAGGTEAQDWTDILLRMYTRWAEKHGYKVELLEQSDGEEAGIKSAVVKISGHNAFGWLKTESGVHRLVRISPFDANARRHTSFASAWVYPVIDDTIQIDINPADCKIDTYRASGAGGQHVNKTESAVRITHIPTGFVVACQDERSQFKNRDRAMRILRSRLFDAQQEQLNRERAVDRKKQVGSGDRSERIRTYNFPQGRVTDHRINLTLYKIDEVMNGTALDEIIEALITEDRLSRLSELD